MGSLSIVTIPSAGASFFFCSWLIMIFWGILADDVGVRTISYRGAMLVTITLWMAVAPLIAAMVRQRVGRAWGRWGDN